LQAFACNQFFFFIFNGIFLTKEIVLSSFNLNTSGNMVQEKLLDWFKNISKASVALAGGKGASLGEMTRAGIPVPNGFVILSASFEKFLESTDLNVEIDSILEKVNHKEMQSIENASEQIKALIMNAKMPKDIEKEIVKDFKILDSKFVAVRSSATSEDSSSAAWAGQLDSFLNTTNKTLLENVKKCWASLFTPRAIFYRFEKGLHTTKISVAVVVQKMVESEVSGIAFSVHPVTQDRNQLIIEAGFGLGEAIVSGQITPDSYVVEKVPRRIIDKNVSEQEKGLFKVQTGGNEWKSVKEKGAEQKLSDKQILELSEIILRIEKHYGFPCDIEWAYEKRKFYIVQSRPITTLTDKSNDELMPVAKEENIPKEGKVNFKEDSLVWVKNYLLNNSFDIKEARLCVPVGEIMFASFARPNRFGNDFSPLFIPYADERVQQVIPIDMMKSLERKVWENAIKDKKKFLKTLTEATKIQKKIDKLALSPNKLSRLKDKQLLGYLAKLENFSCKWWKYSSIGEDKGLVVEEKLIPLILKNHSVTEGEAHEYVSDMTMPDMISVFSKERMLFLDLCIKTKSNKSLLTKITKNELPPSTSFRKLFKEYSKKYFYARTGFYDAINLDETNLIQTIKETIASNSIESLVEEYERLAKSHERLKEKQKVQGAKFTPTKEEENYLWYYKQMHIWMDERKSSMMKHFNYLLAIMREVSSRYNIPYNIVAVMTIEEIAQILSGKKFDIQNFERRHEGMFFVYKKNKVLRFFGEEAKELIASVPKMIVSKDTLVGAIACRGKKGEVIRGRVKIVHNPSKDEFNEGEVLVTSMTRPEFVPIMKKAIAIVTDEGGLTSHAAIVSRELGIPCIIGTKNATKVLHTGDLVEIRASHGQITILQKGEVTSEDSNQTQQGGEKGKVSYKKLFSREYSVLRMQFMTLGEFERIKRLTNGKCYFKPLFISSSDGLVEVYYDFTSPNQQPTSLIPGLMNNFAKVSAEATQAEIYSKELMHILSKNDYSYSKRVFELVSFIQPFSSIGNLLGTLPDAPKELFELFKKHRLDYDGLTYRAEDFLLRIPGSKKNKVGFLTFEEILSGKNIDTSLREKGFCFFMGKIIQKSDLASFISSQNIILETSEQFPILGDYSVLKGQSAYPGKVTGRVRKILTSQAVKFFRQGEILVAPMTTVDFTSAIKSCAAFITDEGGITSHAAIVARELKKPCIIGTKIATRVLQDGDLVEVDANKGIVKVIKKA